MTHTVAQLLEAMESAKAEKNSGRRAAVLINTAIALVIALRRAANQPRQIAEVLGSPQVAIPLADFFKVSYHLLPRHILLKSVSRLYLLMEIFFFGKPVARGLVVWRVLLEQPSLPAKSTP